MYNMSNSFSNYNNLYLNTFNFGFPVKKNELKVKIGKWNNIIYTSNIFTYIKSIIPWSSPPNDHHWAWRSWDRGRIEPVFVIRLFQVYQLLLICRRRFLNCKNSFFMPVLSSRPSRCSPNPKSWNAFPDLFPIVFVQVQGQWRPFY